ncbi:fumarylacetoacetate hydrolase family protein, partial [Mesorhizobium sp. M1348]|uniref:fumarylacetoacetate hydrolase family protein n=1 Tax=Mesorhizobium sp. M1348 TaxID=2957089 RepID=UPI003337BC98
MKLLRFGPPGSERPGLLDEDGAIRDLSSVVPDIRGSTLSRAGLDKLRSAAPSSLPRVEDNVRLGPPVAKVRHFIAVGLNYTDHAIETDTPIPDEPVIFSKAPSCIVGPNDDILMPRDSRMLDWEAEVAVVIGEHAFDLAEEHALSV